MFHCLVVYCKLMLERLHRFSVLATQERLDSSVLLERLGQLVLKAQLAYRDLLAVLVRLAELEISV